MNVLFKSDFPATAITKPGEKLEDVLPVSEGQWVVGSNLLLNTQGEKVNSALIKEIDFIRMYKEGVAKGKEEWALFETIETVNKCKRWMSWLGCLEKFSGEHSSEIISSFYFNQDVVQRIQLVFNTNSWRRIDQFHNTKEHRYIHKRGRDYMTTNALIAGADQFTVREHFLNDNEWQAFYLSHLMLASKDHTMTIVDHRN